MTRATHLKLKQLKVIVIAWMLVGFFITVHDHLFLYTDSSLGPSPAYSFLLSAVRNMGAGFIGALTGGSFLVFYVNVKYQDKPYGYTIIGITIVFILVVALVSLIMALIFLPIQTGKPLTDAANRTALVDFLMNPYPLKAALSWSFIVAITQLLLQVNSKFGQADFWNIIRGKYNRPKEDKRIFMFLDINHSTSIAEQLGDETYHALLKDFFADITAPILENKGSIYQYVGDEVIVAWNYEDGKENIHCLRCFFDMKLHIQKRAEKYLGRYGLVPTFKAGIHCGRVIAGEVGIIKRDITYSGDVLNTTSRILGKCNELNEELIASSDLLAELDIARHYVIRSLGAIKLRGKEREVILNALAPAD